MVRRNDADELCIEMHRVIDQLITREAVAAGTLKASADLLRRVERMRRDHERSDRLKARPVQL